MPPVKLFGSLNLTGMVGRGENPNGFVAQTPNGTNINGEGSDGDDRAWGLTADGPRWNKAEPNLQDTGVSRPIAITATRRR